MSEKVIMLDKNGKRIFAPGGRYTNNPFDKAIGARLHLARRAKGMTMESVAEGVNALNKTKPIGRSLIELYEKGYRKISLEMLLYLSISLGISPIYFFKDFLDESDI